MNLAFGPFTMALAGIIPHSKEQLAKMQQELRRAGFYRPFALQEFLSIRNSLVVGWVLLVAAALWAGYDAVNDPTFKILAVGAIGLMALYAMPRLWVQWVGSNRVQRIQMSLPDGIDMLSMCIAGGLPLRQSLERVSEELKVAHPDIAQEFGIIARHTEAHTTEYAFNQFAKRIDIPEIKSLAALVSQTDRLGTNVASALRDYSDSMRRSFRQRAEERGNKASVKMLFPIALCLAPPVYILLAAPAVLELRDFVVRENRPGGVLQPKGQQTQRLTAEAKATMARTQRERRLQIQKQRAAQNAARAASGFRNQDGSARRQPSGGTPVNASTISAVSTGS